ncbi:MAG: alpha-L-fucosidase [Chitinophagales bacterium]|nr:alpha-L-fucosidase [Chitinophagales bacterium]
MKYCLAICLILTGCIGLQAQSFPKPTPAQIEWHDTEFYFFLHFGPNTFTNLEWGHGTETEDLFQPSALDCDQWCRIAKLAGAKGLIITAKHHDGFCLWPSQFSTHTVRESPWKGGKGDVLQELSEAAKRHGLKLGFYLSPWDRNHPKYGTSEYNDVYANTLTELLTRYGSLFEIWWDGANGEGPNGKKQVYDFHRFEKIAAKLQPDAVIFSDIGPGCRWAGNEEGVIRTETNWCTLDTAGFQRGAGGPPQDTLNQGNVRGAHWIPAECDVSIRPGWFYHPEEDSRVKSPEQLFEIYQYSVGRGANLILNVPPDRRGLIHEQDSVALVGLGKLIRERFQQNLLRGRKRELVHRHCLFIPKRIVSYLNDGDRMTYQRVNLSHEIQFDLRRKQKFSTIVLREYIPEGQHISAFKVEVKKGKKWVEIARSTTIGARKMLKFPEQNARRIRVTILESNIQMPLLSEVELYR